MKRSTRSLKKKLVLAMLLVGALPLFIGLGMAFFTGMREIQEVNGASFEALAEETSRKVDLILGEEITKTRRITTHTDIIRELEQRRDQLLELDDSAIQTLVQEETTGWSRRDENLVQAITAGPLGEILQRYYRGTNAYDEKTISLVTRSSTRALYLTDIAGRLVASINTDVPFHHSKEPWWQGALQHGIGQPYLGSLKFDEALNTYTFSIALPVMDSIRYQAIGVLHRVYDAKEFFAPSIDTIRFGKTGHVMLIDSAGLVVSCPLLSTGVRIADTSLIPMVTPGRRGWVLAPSDGHGGTSQSIIGFAPLPTMTRITQASTGTAWHMFVWQSSEEVFGPIRKFFGWIAGFGVIAVVLLIALGLIAAGRIVKPIRQLQDAARLIAKRQLKEPIVLNTGDEIEELAKEVNTMNKQLQASFAGLTSEVAEKTKEVEYLQESTNQILAGVPDPVILLDEEERIQYANHASKMAFGFHNGMEEGKKFFDFVPMSERDQAKLRKEIEGLRDTEKQGGRTEGNGKRSAGQSSLKDPLAQMDEGDRQEKTMEIAARVFRYDWFPVKSPEGEGKRFGLVLRDATDEKLLQDHLIRNEKATSLAVLSAGIGHELNNPLVGVIGLGEAIQEEQDTSKVKEYAQSIVQHGQRMASVIRDFTGQATGEALGRKTAIDLNEHIDQVLRFIQYTEVSPNIKIEKDFQTIPTFHGLPEDIRQVLLHVIQNAIQAMNGSGVLSLSTRCGDGFITVAIGDSGYGIPKNHLAKVFDPFFTTKTQGEGSGLGLTVVKRLIQKYKGQIHFESQEGQGTVCLISFPMEDSSLSKEEGK